MGYIMFPLLVFALFGGIFAIERANVTLTQPAPGTTSAKWNGMEFVAYRAAVGAYLQKNPAYVGAVSTSSLAGMGYQFSIAFLAGAGNYISQVGAGTGRIVTCHASLPAGALAAALRTTAYDASFGIASGGNWVSYAPGVNTVPQPLAISVPDGDVVSVFQIGP